MTYQILVLDLDGTLMNRKKEITPRTRETLINLQKKGVRVVLASGRPTFGVEPMARELELHTYGGYILSFNGAKIIDCRTNEVIYEKFLPEEEIPGIYELSKKYGCGLMSYKGNNVITEDPKDPFIVLEASINHLPIESVSSFTEYVTFPVNKCIATGEGEYLAGVEPIFQEKLGERLSIYRSEPFFLEIMPKNTDKACALNELLLYLKLTKEEMVACGDGFNDLTMIQYAGMGVAMGNAQPVVKEAADFITKTNEEDGIVYAVEQLFPQYLERG